MPDTIPATLEVDPGAAAALCDPRTRAAMGRLLSRVLSPRPGTSELAKAIADATAEALRRCLTDEIIDEELAAYNAERRERPAHSAAERPRRRGCSPTNSARCVRARPWVRSPSGT